MDEHFAGSKYALAILDLHWSFPRYFLLVHPQGLNTFANEEVEWRPVFRVVDGNAILSHTARRDRLGTVITACTSRPARLALPIPTPGTTAGSILCREYFRYSYDAISMERCRSLCVRDPVTWCELSVHLPKTPFHWYECFRGKSPGVVIPNCVRRLGQLRSAFISFLVGSKLENPATGRAHESHPWSSPIPSLHQPLLRRIPHRLTR